MRPLAKILGLTLLSSTVLSPLPAQSPGGPLTTLHGHVLGRLHEATLLPRTAERARQPLTICIILNRGDDAGFEEFERELNDPNSSQYHKTLSLSEFTARFGPTQQAYDAVLAYLQQNGFTLTTGSANRRTLTVSGTRAQAERALHVSINDYRLGDRVFHAIAADPAVPAELAPLIAGISGLSNLSQLRPANTPNPLTPTSTAIAYDGALTPAGKTNTAGLPPGLNGAGQTVGLIEFDGFDINDVRHWLAFAGLNKDLANQVSTYSISGGTTPSGCLPTDHPCGTTEVLLDIEAAMGIAQGANIIVFEAPLGTDYATVINQAINVIAYSTSGALSMSWGDCEGDHSLSDVTSIDSLLADATTYGVTLFANTGDFAGNCTDGSGKVFLNGIGFPSDARHAIAVGGTVLSVNSNNTYQHESWWGDPLTPAPGTSTFGGGFGVSQFTAEPKYQVPFYSGATGRSVPDVAAESSPGIAICQATPSQSPNCPAATKGGTSLAAPIWAAIWALALQATVDSGGFVWSPAGDYFYTIPDAFHSPSSFSGPGNDFAHLGLGSPDITTLIAKGIHPRADSFSPSSGSASGGTTVTIKGAGFVAVKKVTFGGVAGTHVTIHSDTELTVDSPAAADFTVPIEVETLGGKATVSGEYAYVPEIHGVSPNFGPLDGGIAVTVTGLALSDSLTFIFGIPSGGGLGTSVKCSSSKSCTMVVPAHAAGTIDVIAETPWDYGSSVANSKDQFTYQGPSIKSFTPTSGPTTGGVLVGLSGTGLRNGKTTVSFGGAGAKSVNCPTSIYCSMKSPAHDAGSVTLTVTVAGVISAPSTGEYTFVVYPTLTGISPSSGAAGDTVTLTGTGFTTPASGRGIAPDAVSTSVTPAFSFSGQAATGVKCTSETQCTAVVPPAGRTQKAFVTVTVNGLTSTDGVTFSYSTSPVIPPCKGLGCRQPR